MRRTLALSIATLALLAGLAAAAPEVTVSYREGIPVIQLAGSFSGSSYTVYRADPGAQEFLAITGTDVLCIGECLVADWNALPGQTYLYRFDLLMPNGRFESFGPFAVTIPRERPMSAVVAPNPGRGPASLTVTLAGRPNDPPIMVEIALFDLQGRALRSLHRGPLSRGTTSLAWDGLDSAGRPLASGLYFVRLRSASGILTTALVRTR